jgi:hypothetical protein
MNFATDFSAASNYAIFALKEKLPRMRCEFAWLVEGRSELDLPEGVVACMRFNYLTPDNAAQAKDFFSIPVRGFFASQLS